MLAHRCAAALALALGVTTAAGAQSATQTVTFQVSAINVIGFTGSPSLTISGAAPGAASLTATDASATWAVTTNQSTAKISASIASAMPTGLTLSVNLAAPTGASTAGSTALGTTGVDLVTSITQLSQTGLGVTYTLAASPTAGVVASGTRVVTYTISGGT